jgi:hypothetical protein
MDLDAVLAAGDGLGLANTVGRRGGCGGEDAEGKDGGKGLEGDHFASLVDKE